MPAKRLTFGTHRDYAGSVEAINGVPAADDQKLDHSEVNQISEAIDDHADRIDSLAETSDAQGQTVSQNADTIEALTQSTADNADAVEALAEQNSQQGQAIANNADAIETTEDALEQALQPDESTMQLTLS